MKADTYRNAVINKFTIYNSLFLNLPFKDIYKTGTLLPLFEQTARRGFDQELTPVEIVEQFLSEILPESGQTDKTDLLFRFIQYVERQVVLFDSVEDAAYETINQTEGKGSFRQLFTRIKADGLTQALLQKLRNFSLRIVLTAHPTQFYPGHVLAIITDLEEAIRNKNLTHIDLLLQQLGKTPFMNKEKPSPYDEAISLCWYLENIFYKSVPEVVEKILDFTETSIEEFNNPAIVTIGFWPGGDRDGNPYVTHDITKKVAERLRDTALKCYYRDIRILRRRLTFKGLDELIMHIEKKLFDSVYGNRNEGYQDIKELRNDLSETRRILIEKHNDLFLNMLDKFILKVSLFGFHMASLDIRQDSRKHRELLQELLPGTEHVWSGKEAFDKVKLSKILDIKPIIDQEKVREDFYKEMLHTFRILPELQKQNGEVGCHRYIISNAMYPADVLGVYILARSAFKESGNLPMDIVPLFESIEFLEKAAEVMETLYNLEEYRKHLSNRNNKQIIMLGFSDGTKDGGYLQANYSIFKAKESLTAVSRKYGITVVFFDGRGGPPARGGGNTHDFYASQGPGIENKEIQLTIQGQTISANFGKPVSCAYNVEQLITASLENDLYPNRNRNLNLEERQIMEELAKTSYAAYSDLKDHPAFVPYLEHVTPLKYFGLTNIGSRPAKRGSTTSFSFEDLRAIPFVGSWAQMKQNVPGFFGLGKAIEKFTNDGKIDQVKLLYKNSLFFRALIGNSMQSLAKAFYPATAYLRYHDKYGTFWESLYEEYRRTINYLSEISGQENLLEDNVLSRESIKLREKIVLPLITIQQYALQKLLEEGENLNEQEQQQLEALILRCMYGIINAARNAA